MFPSSLRWELNRELTCRFDITSRLESSEENGRFPKAWGILDPWQRFIRLDPTVKSFISRCSVEPWYSRITCYSIILAPPYLLPHTCYYIPKIPLLVLHCVLSSLAFYSAIHLFCSLLFSAHTSSKGSLTRISRPRLGIAGSASHPGLTSD